MAKAVKITPIEKVFDTIREKGDFSIFRKTKEPYDNQIDCALDILCTFSNKRPRHNYVVVKGNTQSGKTGVFVSLINIIYGLKLSESYLNINKIFYITGDNSVQQKKQTTESLEGCLANIEVMAANGLKVILLKRSDMSKKTWEKIAEENNISSTDINNSMFFIDESHYGSGQEKNVLIKWLGNGGLTLRNDSDLIKKNVYIISNSATPYPEIESDLADTKQYVFYKPGNGYKGLWDFKYDFIEKDIFTCDNETVETYLKKWYKHLESIERERGKVKCVVARITFAKYRKYQDIIDKYFDVIQIDSSGGTIDYQKMECAIMSYCKDGFGRTKFNSRKKKFLMVIVKGGLRMAVRINEDVKDLIGPIYDYTATKENVTATEQGVWGRLCGYRNKNGEYKDTIICVNRSHGEALLNFYCSTEEDSEGKKARTPFTRIKKIEKYEFDSKDHSKEYLKKFKDSSSFDKKDWHPVGKRYDYENTESDYCKQWSISPQEWFESKIGTDFFKGFDNFQLEDLLTPKMKNFDAFVKPFLIEQDKFYKDAQILGTRRWSEDGQSDESFCKNFKTTPPLLNSYAYRIYLEGKKGVDNIGRTAYRTLLDVRDLSNIKICTVVGEITWGKSTEKDVTIPIEKKKVIVKTMNTAMAL